MITRAATQELERQIILKVLEANAWSRRKTAKWLNISYRSLLYKLQETQLSGFSDTPSEAANPASMSIRFRPRPHRRNQADVDRETLRTEAQSYPGAS